MNIFDFFEHDHREIDVIFEKVDFSQPQETLPQFQNFDRRLERHIVWEEDILFPAIVEINPQLEQGPVRVMKGEHEMIRFNKGQTAQALRSGDGERAKQFAQEMSKILMEHNKKEEMVLYPICDRLLQSQKINEILTRIRREEN